MRVGSVVEEALKLIRASTPTTIEIRQDLAADGTVMADPTGINQIIMNLCTNANHAMSSKGGVLKVSLDSINVDSDPKFRSLGLQPGSHLRLNVSDTGQGIQPSDIERIFEPYFTTKGPTEGTGLGLAVVHGIVKSFGGAVDVHSQVGEGTTFSVFLPTIGGETEVTANESQTEIPLGNKEHILFVDDEQVLVEIGEQMLTRLGYQVTTRTSSLEALDLFRAKRSLFDLVITDLTMPNMVGVDLAREIHRIRPDIPVILCTGYSERLTERRAKELGISEFLMKPIAMEQIATTIRNILDEKKSAKRQP